MKNPSQNSSTIAWSTDLERANFLKLPKTIAFLGRYDQRIGSAIRPHHILLIIALACRKYQREPIRASWADLAGGLGVTPDSVRRWAYQLRDWDLLRIQHHFDDPGETDRRNSFDIGPFVHLVQRAYDKWRARHEPDNAT